MPREKPPKETITELQLRQIREMAEAMRYGTISLVIQDGVLVQIDRNEKIRISK